MITILNGSPNKNSMTLALTENFLLNQSEEFEVFHCYDLDIVSCDDCKFCDHKLACNKVDDMHKIYKALEQTDTLILSSPIYFGALSNELMQVINRFQRYYAQKYVHKKPLNIKLKQLILVTSAGSKSTQMFNGAKLTYDILVSLFNPDTHHIVKASNTDHIDPINNDEAIKQIEQIKKR